MFKNMLIISKNQINLFIKKRMDIKKFILSWEGGFANDPDDLGGATNSGVTLSTYRMYYGQDKTVEDLKKMCYDD